MKLINTALLTPRNIIVIGLISLGIHMLASPLYKMIDKTPSPATGT